MRDRFKARHILENSLLLKQKFFEKLNYAFYLERFNADHRLLKNGSKNLAIISGQFLTAEIQLSQLEYTLGHSVESIRDARLAELVKRYRYLCDELSQGHPNKFIFRPGAGGLAPSQLHTCFSVLTWFLCLGASKDDLSLIVPYLVKGGQDRFTDVVCGFYHPGREIAKRCAFPKTFSLLDKITTARPAERPSLVKHYLDHWPKIVDVVGRDSLGVACNFPGKIRTVENMTNGIDAHYRGYWSWEAALAVKFFHIDDSAFKDHLFYPYDLVHFTMPLQNKNYLASLDLEDGEGSRKGAISISTADLIILENKEKGSKVAPLKSKENEKNYLYHAYKLKKEIVDEPSPNVVFDSAIRYMVYLETDQDRVGSEEGEASYAASLEAKFSTHHESMTMHELIDEHGHSVMHSFMEEVHLHIYGDQNESAYVYCSRAKESTVDPLLILRYRKFIDGKALIVDCMVRDEAITVSEVCEHWDSLIDKYHNII